MGSTPNFGLPWPELGDDADGPGAFKALAEATESVLSTLMYDSTWLEDPVGLVTASAGWSLVGWRFRRVGPNVAAMLVAFDRTGGTITVPADGDIGNQEMGIVTSPAWIPTTATQPLSPASSGRVSAGYIGNTGIIMLASVAGSASIVNGDRIQLGGVYLLN